MKSKMFTARSAEELGQVLGLSAAEALEWQVQYKLLKDLRRIVKEGNLIHAQVAQRAGSSRTRVTAILNWNLDNVSSDLLIRLLASLGCRIRISISRLDSAA